MDDTADLLSLRNLIREFVSERDWAQFHTPKNLAMAMSIEAAEVMEHFQWLLTGHELPDAKKRVHRAFPGKAALIFRKK